MRSKLRTATRFRVGSRRRVRRAPQPFGLLCRLVPEWPDAAQRFATAMTARDGNGRRRLWALVASFAMLVVHAAASERAGPDTAVNGPGVVVADGRELIVLHPRGPGAGLEPAVRESSEVVARSHEAGSQRIHVVELDGETYRAATPIEGSGSRIVFDPARRRFESLLPSIRVGLDGGVDAEAVAASLAATRVTAFESLGFAIVDLPVDLHPVEAVRRVRDLPGGTTAAVRLRAHRIDWK